MAKALRLWTIDNANGPLEPWLAQTRDGSAAVAQDDEETPQIQLVEQRFITVRKRWLDAFALGRATPLCGGCYRATI